MRILLVTGDFPNPLQAGRGTFNAQMARALARRHDVVVIAPVPWRDEWRLRKKTRIAERVRAFEGMEVHHPRYIYPPGMLRTAYAWFMWRSVASTVRRVLERFTPDVVVSYWLHPDGAVAIRAAARAGVPAVVMSGGSDVLLLAADPGRRACIADVLRRADAVVCVSEHLARAAVEVAGADIPVHVVRRGVDRARFQPGDRGEARARLGWDPSRAALVWVGRMVPVKGLNVLIDACAALDRRGVDVSLHLAGDGPLAAELRRQADKAGIGGKVDFAGTVPHGHLADWYRAADATVLPSLSEGVPNVLLESIACGTPFVASDVGGIREIADDRADRLVPAGDAGALADGVAEVLRRPRGGARRFAPGSWAESADALEAVCRSAIAGRAATRQPEGRS